MKTTAALVGTILFLAIMFSPVSSNAVPNLIQNGDFEDGLNHWTTSGIVNVLDTSGPWFSPSGDFSNFAKIVSRRNQPDSWMAQTVDMPDWEDFRLRLDFTMVTLEPSWGDDFRAEMWIDFLGGGPYTPVFSYGTGDGVFQDYGPPRPNLRYYTQQGFTYDFKWNNPDEDLVLRFLVLGYGPDDDKSNMLLDNMQLYAVPEPGTISLMILGLSLAGAGFIRRKKS
jgi:hypothetical protein